MHNSSYLDRNGVWKLTTTQSSTSFSKKTRIWGCCGLRNENTGQWRIGKTLSGLMNPGSCCFTLMGGLGYGENHMSTCIHLAVSTLQAGGSVMVWGCVFMALIGSLDKSGVMFECHRISEHHCQSGANLIANLHWM